jgi:hypothetical protein
MGEQPVMTAATKRHVSNLIILQLSDAKIDNYRM